jgi:pantothenate kinase
MHGDDELSTDELAAWIRERSAGADRYLFGIAGPPGSGKSTLAERLGADLGAPVVPMDGFHLPNATLRARGQLEVKGAPETFAAADFVALVAELRAPGRMVECPAFDRTLDEPVPGRVRVSPDDVVVVVEGNYLLLDRPPWSSLRDLFDSIGYLDVPAVVRLQRLVGRHVVFGRSPAEATEFVQRSDEVNAALVEASRTRADLVVSPVRGGLGFSVRVSPQ